MTRPDEIAALADENKSLGRRTDAELEAMFGSMYHGWDRGLNITQERFGDGETKFTETPMTELELAARYVAAEIGINIYEIANKAAFAPIIVYSQIQARLGPLFDRLSATPPGDAVREALEESKHWHERADKALSKSGRGDADYHWRRNQHKEEIERIEAALAPAEKARDELKVACASCKKIPGPHCQRPTCAFRDYIDTRTVKTVLAMTYSELSVIPASAVESGREMARQAIAATPTPPSADVALLRHLSGCARAFLQHFNPCDLAEDKAQQWQALEHQCGLADAAIQSAAATPPSL